MKKFVEKKRKQLKAFKATFKAGLIESNCKTGCYADDVNEVIVPCALHEAEIARLSKISLENWED